MCVATGPHPNGQGHMNYYSCDLLNNHSGLKYLTCQTLTTERWSLASSLFLPSSLQGRAVSFQAVAVRTELACVLNPSRWWATAASLEKGLSDSACRHAVLWETEATVPHCPGKGGTGLGHPQFGSHGPDRLLFATTQPCRWSLNVATANTAMRGHRGGCVPPAPQIVFTNKACPAPWL